MDKKEFEALQQMLKDRDILLDTTDRTHRKAFLEGEKHLMKDGKVDYSLLDDDEELQEQVRTTMVDHYMTAAKKALKADPEGDLEENLLLKAYIGATKEQIKRQIGPGYNADKHDELKASLKKEQRNELSGIIYGKIKDKHAAHILRHTKLEERYDPSKMTVDDLASLMELYHANKGQVPVDFGKGKIFYKKPTK